MIRFLGLRKRNWYLIETIEIVAIQGSDIIVSPTPINSIIYNPDMLNTSSITLYSFGTVFSRNFARLLHKIVQRSCIYMIRNKYIRNSRTMNTLTIYCIITLILSNRSLSTSTYIPNIFLIFLK